MYEIHPIANIFPRMPESELAALAEDIGNNGLLEPIWLFDGKILDGRHRYSACESAGVEPEFRQYEGDDPLGFVISLNLKRRHLTESQRAMVASELANMEVGDNKGAHRPSEGSANLHTLPGQVSQSDAATLLQVSTRLVATAAKINRDAPEEVSEAVKSGEVSLNLASQFIALTEEEQRVALDAITEESEPAKEAIKEAVRNHRTLGTGENEWYTPSEYIEMARLVMGGIDLDPASSEAANATVKASRIFTAEDDGLTKDWSGKVWMNPPYSRDLMPAFVEKLSQSFIDGSIESAVMLSHNNTDTRWFHRVSEVALAICFPKTRIRFYRGDEVAAPTNGQAFFYLGNNPELFAEKFSEIGLVVTPWKKR
jgi:ParB family chromosome partitioning protein